MKLSIKKSYLFIQKFIPFLRALLAQLSKLIIVGLFLFESSQAFSQSRDWKNPLGSQAFGEYRQKAEQKKGSRWTLQEWLEQKERNRMMDLWLGMYAPSPYEFYLEAIYTNATQRLASTEQLTWNYEGRAGLSVLILGLEGGYQNNWISGERESYGQLRLRVLGNAVQGTHLILGAGQSDRTRFGTNFRQALYTADLDVYIERHSGLHFAYRSYPEAKIGELTTQGAKMEAGLFFDLSFLQLFVRYFDERIKDFDPGPAITTETKEQGTEAGFKIFF